MTGFQIDPWGPVPNQLGSGVADGGGSVLSGGDIGGMASIFGASPQGALINAGSQVLGQMLRPSNAGPSRADSSQWLNQTFDNSGWTVATGKASAQGGARGLDLPPWMILAGIGLVVVGWVRTRK